MTKKAASAAWYVLSRLDHDGKTYLPGDGIDALGEEQAQELQALGVLSRVAPVADDAPAT